MGRLPHDSSGFLTGSPIDLSSATKYLKDIKQTIADIKKAVTAISRVSLNPPRLNPEPVPRQQAAPIAATPQNRQTINYNRDAHGRFISANGSAQAVNNNAPRAIVTPAVPAQTQVINEPIAPNREVVTPRLRGQSGSNESSSNTGAIVNGLSGIASAVSGITSRATSATTAGVNVLGESDPTAAAFREVAEPLKRGFGVLFGAGETKESGWLKKLYTKSIAFFKSESAFARAERDSLREIAQNGQGSGESSSGIMGFLLGFLTRGPLANIGTLIATTLRSSLLRLGPALITAISAIFSPIGIAVGATIGAAWGLFTESGQKFFGDVVAQLISAWDTVTTAFAPISEYIGKKWDGLVEEFKPITDSIGKGWNTIKDSFDSLVNGMSESWNAFTNFLKDKFGIDIPAIAKKTAEVVSNGAEAVKKGADVVANKASEVGNKANDYVKEKTGIDIKGGAKIIAEDFKNGINAFSNKTAEGASNIKENAIKKHAQNNFNEVDAALNFKGNGQITGLSDTETRALAANTAKTESGGNVASDNKQGYFGQYQFGGEALAEAGLVDEQKLKTAKNSMSSKDWYKKRTADGQLGGHEAFLRDQSNWKTEGGLDAFLKDKSLQDKAFITYTNKNIAGGIRSGAISANDSAGNIAGYSKAAHLKGVGGANKLFKQGIASTDGNGTSTATYAKQAAAAMGTTVAGIESKSPIAIRNSALPAVTTSQEVPQYAPQFKPKPLAETIQVPTQLNTQESAPQVVHLANNDVGQDLCDRGMAHICTGGYARQ